MPEEALFIGKKASEMTPLGGSIPSTFYVMVADDSNSQWKRIPYSTFVALVNSVLGDPATPSTDPGTPTNAQIRYLNGAGTYTHFLSASSTPITVGAAEGVTWAQYNPTTGYWVKNVSTQDLGNYYNKIISDGKYLAADVNGNFPGGVASPTQWVHPRGAGELTGDGTFSRVGIMFNEPVTNNVVFNKIQLAAWGGATSVLTVRIYKSASFNANPSSLTLLEEVLYPAGTFNRVVGNATIQLINNYAAKTGEYIYVAILTTAGTNITVARWTSAYGSAPERHAVYYFDSTVNSWTTSWSASSLPAFGQTSFILLYDNLKITSLENRVAPLESSVASNTLNIASNASILNDVTTKDFASYVEPIPLASCGYLYTNSTFSGWETAMGVQNNFSGVISRIAATAAGATITSIKWGIFVDNEAGTQVAGSTMTVNIPAGTYQDVIFDMGFVYPNSANSKLVFIYLCNAPCNLFGKVDSTTFPQPTYQNTKYQTNGVQTYVLNPVTQTSPSNTYSWFKIGILSGVLKSTVVNGIVAASDTSFRTNFDNAPKTNFTNSYVQDSISLDKIALFTSAAFRQVTDIFSGWGTPIGTPRLFNAIRYRLKSRSGGANITSVRQILRIGSNTGQIIQDTTYSVNIPSGTDKYVVFLLGTTYKFTVSGITSAPAIGDAYIGVNGNSYKVIEVSLSAGAGYLSMIRTTTSTADPAASGNLTRSSGSGDATIAFSASAVINGVENLTSQKLFFAYAANAQVDLYGIAGSNGWLEANGYGRSVYYGSGSMTGNGNLDSSPDTERIWCEIGNFTPIVGFTTAMLTYLSNQLGASLPTIRCGLPSQLYALEGKELNVYWDNIIFSDFGRADLDIDVTCTKGQQLDKRWTYTPVAADAGTTTLTISIKYKGVEMVNKVANIITKTLASGSGSSVKVIVFGDSTLVAAQYLPPVTSVLTLGTITGGTGYTNGTYTNVPLVNGTNQIRANVVVSGGAVSSITIVNGGGGFSVGNVLTVSSASIGGTGSGFSVSVASIEALPTNPTITFQGSLGTGNLKHEGRSGYRYSDYATAGRSLYKFILSGVTTTPGVNSTYTTNGSTYTVQEINLTSGSGYVTFTKSGTNDPTASGTLTRSSGTGDATLTFSSFTIPSANPLWNNSTGALDVASYLTNLGVTMTATDMFIFNLGINDCFFYTTFDATAAAIVKGQIDSIIAACRAAVAGIRVGISLIIPASISQDAFGINYGNNQTLAGYMANRNAFNDMILANYDTSSMRTAGTYVVPFNVNIDRVSNMQKSIVAANARNATDTVVQYNNDVHPANAGYYQKADTLLSYIKSFF